MSSYIYIGSSAQLQSVGSGFGLVVPPASSDTATVPLTIQGENAFSTATNNLSGGSVVIDAGLGASGLGFGSVSINNQVYGGQRVATGFSVSATGLATGPSQFFIPVVGGQNMAFDANLFVQQAGSGGVRLALSAPSGAQVLMGGAGPTGFDAFQFSGTAQASVVGTAIYAGSVGQTNQITVAGSITSVAGVTGPVMVSVMPWTNGHTGTILAGSNMFVYPST